MIGRHLPRGIGATPFNGVIFSAPKLRAAILRAAILCTAILAAAMLGAPALGEPIANAYYCRYTVRDIGFVDLLGPDYALRLHASSDSLSDAEEALRRFDPEGDSNLRFEPVPAEGPARWSLACAFRPEIELSSIDVSAKDLGAKEAFSKVVGGQTAAYMAKNALGVFAYALVVEGSQEDKRVAAHDLVKEVRERLDEAADQLPRRIEWPLTTVTVQAADRERERILLWALGLNQNAQETAVVFIYGRGKLAGPPLIGDGLKLREALEQVVLIGESCECDTSRPWNDEPRIPLLWNDERRTEAAVSLGFESESPMVTGEVARILAKNPGEYDERRTDGIESLLFGYKETNLTGTTPSPRGGVAGSSHTPSEATVRVVDAGDGDWDFADDSGDPATSTLTNLTPSSGTPDSPQPTDTPSGPEAKRPPISLRSMTWFAATACLLLIAAGLGVLVLRGRDR